MSGLVLIEDVPLGHLPSDVPLGWESAKLPRLYVRARAALEGCEQIDECREWENQAAAAAAYYRQAKDKTLLWFAERIRIRAIRRFGELMMAHPHLLDAPGRRHPKIMDRAKISKSKRVAKCPPAIFNRLVERSPPATVSEIVGYGTVQRDGGEDTDRVQKIRDAREFVRMIGAVNENRFTPEYIVSALSNRWQISGDERKERLDIMAVYILLDDIVEGLPPVKEEPILEDADWVA